MVEGELNEKNFGENNGKRAVLCAFKGAVEKLLF
jgi:hypothetical protein